MIVHLQVDPEIIVLEPGSCRDIRNLGHYRTGDLEVTIRTQEDLGREKPLLKTSYGGSDYVPS